MAKPQFVKSEISLKRREGSAQSLRRNPARVQAGASSAEVREEPPPFSGSLGYARHQAGHWPSHFPSNSHQTGECCYLC